MNQQGYHFDIAPSLIRKEGYCDREVWQLLIFFKKLMEDILVKQWFHFEEPLFLQTILAQRALICLPGLPPSANQGPERRYLISGGKIQVAAVDLIVADLKTVGQHNNGNVAISKASSSFSGEDQSQGTSVASPVFSSITRRSQGQLGLRSRVSFPMPSAMDNDRTGQADRNFGSISDKYMGRTQQGPEHDAMAATVIGHRNQQGPNSGDHIASVWNVETSEANLVANVEEDGHGDIAEPVIPKRRGRPRATVQVNDEDSDCVPQKRAKGKVEEENLWKKRNAPIFKRIGRPPKQATVTSKKSTPRDEEKYLARRAKNRIAVQKHRAKKIEEDRIARERLAELEKLVALRRIP